jgi:hypothetical protein
VRAQCKIKVKGTGQECPLRAYLGGPGNSRFLHCAVADVPASVGMKFCLKE